MCLGFRCLDFPSFLQYVEHDVFQLNKNFLLKFLKDLPDDQRVNREKKKIILSMLPSVSFWILATQEISDNTLRNIPQKW